MRHLDLPRTSLIVLPVALLATALVVAGSAPAATKTLSGSVGPGFTISLKYKGKKVVQADARPLPDQGQRQVRLPQLPHQRARREPPHHDGRLRGHEEPHLQAQEGDVPLRVRPARRRDEGQLQGRLTCGGSLSACCSSPPRSPRSRWRRLPARGPIASGAMAMWPSRSHRTRYVVRTTYAVPSSWRSPAVAAGP